MKKNKIKKIIFIFLKNDIFVISRVVTWRHMISRDCDGLGKITVIRSKLTKKYFFHKNYKGSKRVYCTLLPCDDTAKSSEFRSFQHFLHNRRPESICPSGIFKHRIIFHFLFAPLQRLQIKPLYCLCQMLLRPVFVWPQ